MAHGEDAELVESQLQPVGKLLTDLDGMAEGRSSPTSDNGVMRADTDSLIVGGGGSSASSSSASRGTANRYSYRAAIYQHPENQQDIG